ncbi:hypothetical protein P170DRAFT_369279 [Aspergillus steynii IBT 23096]|uniref:Xylanolytic transcriptional activator regulatory domain-containing protein n=1 Tax=Aspergillus steynii IBT 23096 TaxID=1392250 RepID=A0A2I2FSW8_9EURO|nr:uncharacterized protein P170DRAFT_369279 [Aspergillus steynii IBT 23096]PLB43733.1 hypothetical protein P170DRAFT_369279 [Aspergillus steynii IBT 23096]
MSNASSPSTSPFNAQQLACGTERSSKQACADVSRDNTAEYEGESSFSAHALFATKFLQNVVSSNDYSKEVVQEMTSIVDTLREIIHAQKQQSDCPEELYPYARPRPSDSSLQHLPMPPIDIALSALWKAKEIPYIRFNWLYEFVSIAQFTDYFVKVYSPASTTDADRIIVNAGLYWLFSESAELIPDQQTKDDYRDHASQCRGNLETILSSLSFHIPATIDYVLALSVATTYCRQVAKPSLAWSYIKTASLMCQTLGLHGTHGLHTESPEIRRQKIHLFWAIFTTERTLSLRFGRSSTFRDQDITIPRLSILHYQEQDSLLNPVLPRWIDIAGLQGRTYDEIYSPGALIQPAHVRESRARALAADLRKVMGTEDPLETKYNSLRRHALGDTIHELILHADRVSTLSILTLIYRGIPPDRPSGAAFSSECITAAREALVEHEKCISTITTADIHPCFIEIYITYSLLESPFLPFIVLFCHIIETSSPDDLRRLGTVVETLQSTSPSAFYRACSKQFRLFSALYHVARKYVEVKETQPRGWMNPIDFVPSVNLSVPNMGSGSASASASASVPTQLPFPDSSPSSMPRIVRENAISQPGDPLTSTGITPTNHIDRDAFATPQPPQWTQIQTQPSLEMDAMGTELGNWFYENQQMLKFLDDSYTF